MLNNKINIPKSSLPMRKIYFKMKSSCIEKRLSKFYSWQKSQIKNYITATWLYAIQKVWAFIQALLSAAVLPQRFSFFTVWLVQWLRGVVQRTRFRV